LEEQAWYLAYRVPSSLMRLSEEGHFLAGTGTSGCLGDLQKGGIRPNPQALQAQPHG